MKTTTTNCLPADEIEDAELDSQASELLIAKLTTAGHTITKSTSGGFLVSRWGHSLHCMDSESLQAFAKQVGVT